MEGFPREHDHCVGTADPVTMTRCRAHRPLRSGPTPASRETLDHSAFAAPGGGTVQGTRCWPRERRGDAGRQGPTRMDDVAAQAGGGEPARPLTRELHLFPLRHR